MLVVLYSLSMTAIILLFLSVIIIGVTLGKSYRVQIILILIIVLVISLTVYPDLGNRVVSVFQMFFTATSSNRLITNQVYFFYNLRYRLFENLDINDTVVKIIFGSTYNVAVPTGFSSSSAILPHNGYKEIYLVGGLFTLGLYLLMFVFTSKKMLFLIRNRRKLPEDYTGTALSVSFAYILLLLTMAFYPIYHSNGVGIVFWCSVGLINNIYDTL